ncbi:MAG: aspartate-semialdehyde dehydrogenase [Chlamydiales bacterium]|nr:aspartate-semialdehyde dehydrogenase [Chlamydiales bacterium]
MKKIPVGVLGATGMVGQHYLNLLDNHPWFEVVFLGASEKSADKTYEEAILNRFFLKSPLSKRLLNLKVQAVSSDQNLLTHVKRNCSFVFSALDTTTAKCYEEVWAQAGIPIVSNASAHRNSEDVPVLIPEINPHHLKIIPIQKRNRGWDNGFIVTKPNCSIQSYIAPLFAINAQFPIKRVIALTMQAVSGAGWPGVSSLDILGNVIPFISGEEEKSETEPLKVLGTIKNDKIVPNQDLVFSAHCNRVSVLDGHLACISIELAKDIPDKDEVLHLWSIFKGNTHVQSLPSSPKQPIIYLEEENRPQPRLDCEREKGMTTCVGRLRSCNALHLRFVGLSHNIIRGAAGGGILNAELLHALEYF